MSQEPSDLAKPAKQEVYVDELADGDDYWLTITDAARATLRQDITIRRWIYSGDLPVRRKKVGRNQRTRQVRASDLGQLTPILNLPMIITSEEGRLDLMAIPQQQTTILAQNKALQEAQIAISQGIQAVQQSMADHKVKTRQALDALLQEVTSRLQALQAEYAIQLAEHQEAHQAELQHVQVALTAQIEALRAEVQGLNEQLSQNSTTHQAAHQLLEQRLTTLEAAQTVLEQAILTQQQQMHQDLATLKQDIDQQIQTWLNQFEERMDRAVNLIVERVDTIQTTQTTHTEHIESLRTQAARASAWTTRLEQLESAVQQAAEERATLRGRIAALEGHQRPDEKADRS